MKRLRRRPLSIRVFAAFFLSSALIAFVDGLRMWLSGLIDKAAETVQGVTG